jgi:hypothetical protein
MTNGSSIFELTYERESSEILIEEIVGNNRVVRINLANFESDLNSKLSAVQSLIKSGIFHFRGSASEERLLRFSFNNLWKRGEKLSDNQIDILKRNLLWWSKLKRRNDITLAENISEKDFGVEEGKRTFTLEGSPFFLRLGIVELRVLEAYIQNRDVLFSSLKKVMDNHLSSEYMKSLAQNTSYLFQDDLEWNIRRLMTNAGFYSDGSYQNAVQNLDIWCNTYLRAVDLGDAEFRVPGLFYQGLYTYQRRAGLSGSDIPFTKISVRGWYEQLENQVIVFVTPFAKQISQIFGSEHMPNLYEDYKLKKFSVITVEAPMSIFPHRPHRDWQQSYESTLEQVRKCVRKNKATLFIAAAGSYGLPLCSAVHEEFEIASIYRGHFSNSLFGVLSGNATSNFGGFNRVLSNWQRSHLSSVEGLAKIDNGRYI